MDLIKIPVIRETKNILIYGAILFFIISFILSLVIIDLDFSGKIILALFIAITVTIMSIIFLYLVGIYSLLRMSLWAAKYGKNKMNAYIVIFVPVILFATNLFRINYLYSLIQENKNFGFLIIFGFLFEVVCPIINYFLFEKISQKYKLNFG
ncbi:hypothetical protein HY637_01030 [Candidatus Woesearchaeota archaeon]|nr:hypothetical protein [Candidatus Woesearchaeota archaeon]